MTGKDEDEIAVTAQKMMDLADHIGQIQEDVKYACREIKTFGENRPECDDIFISGDSLRKSLNTLAMALDRAALCRHEIHKY